MCKPLNVVNIYRLALQVYIFSLFFDLLKILFRLASQIDFSWSNLHNELSFASGHRYGLSWASDVLTRLISHVLAGHSSCFDCMISHPHRLVDQTLCFLYIPSTVYHNNAIYAWKFTVELHYDSEQTVRNGNPSAAATATKNIDIILTEPSSSWDDHMIPTRYLWCRWSPVSLTWLSRKLSLRFHRGRCQGTLIDVVPVFPNQYTF